MRLLLPALVASMALGLAACGGAGQTGSTAAASSPASTAGATTSSVKTVTATATATATGTGTAASGTSPTGGAAVGASTTGCRAAGLALSFLGQQGATGHGELGFAVRNTGSSSCETVGYPGIQFLDRAGGDLPTVPTHTTQDFFGSSKLAPVSLAAGQSASFRLGVTHVSANGSTCTTAYGLQVIAPNDTATLRVSLPGGAAECATATVSPMQSGLSAYH